VSVSEQARSGDPGPDALDHRRLRTTWQVAAAGPVLGAVAAAAAGAIGLSGRAGLAALLLVTALALVLAALVTIVQATVDEWAHRPVARRRPLTALGLFLGAGAVLLLLGGVSGGG
jgi:hypothetical protein